MTSVRDYQIHMTGNVYKKNLNLRTSNKAILKYKTRFSA